MTSTCSARWRRRQVLAGAGCAALLRAPPAASQVRPALRILPGTASSLGLAVAQALVDRVANSVVVTGPAELRATQPPTAYVAIGAAALEAAAAQPLNAPLLSLLVSRQAYQQLSLSEARRAGALTAIHAEPSPDQQMRVIRAVFARPVSVGTLISAAATDMEVALQAAARREKLRLQPLPFVPELGLLRNLARLADAGVLLIFPDTSIYTPRSLRELLEATYRRRQPVVGFSAALVSAGTLASAHSSAEDLATQAVQVIAEIHAGRLPAAQYPRYWQVAINDSVARSLDIVIDPAARQLGERP